MTAAIVDLQPTVDAMEAAQTLVWPNLLYLHAHKSTDGKVRLISAVRALSIQIFCR